jgi:hypothetical protein
LGAVSSSSANSTPADQAYVQSLLAKEVLAEVPEQVTSYFKSRAIPPLQNQPPPIYQQQQQPMYPDVYGNQSHQQIPYPPANLDDINFKMQHSLNVQSSAPMEEGQF